MSCSRTLEFCVNHSFLLDLKKPRIFDSNFVDKIKSIKPQLELFLTYYKKFEEHNVAEFRKSDNKLYIKEFVIKLSQFLNLSSSISFDILRNYLAIDRKINVDNLESMLTRGYDTLSLMKSIGKYYRNERLSLIRLVRYPFCERKDEWRIIANIILTVSGHNDVHSLYVKILKCYEVVVDEMFQSRSIIDHREDISDDEYVMQSLEEQVLLLETLLLGTSFMKETHTKMIMTSMLRIFQISLHKTESRISRTISSKPSVKNMLERIVLLQSLVIVEAVQLDGLFCSGDDLRSHFMSDGDTLLVLNAVASRLGNRRCDGVLMLLTSLLCTAFPLKITSQSSVSKLAEQAISKLELFKYLSSVLTSEPYAITQSNCSQLELVVHRAIFDLLSFMCHHIHSNSFESSIRHDIVTVMSELLRPINLYSDVKFLKTGFLKMLEDLSLSFPLNLDMLMVVSSLMDKSVVEREGGNDIIIVLCDFLDNLPWFCDRGSIESNCVKIDDVYDDDGKCARSCQLISQYRPYPTRRTVLSLEKGQEGFILDDAVVWSVQYGSWDIISAEIELTIMILSGHLTNEAKDILGPSMVTSISNQFRRLETILDFLTTCIKSNVRRDMIVTLFCELWALVDNDQFLVEGCEGSLVKMMDIAGHVLTLTTDPDIIMRIVSTKILFPICHASQQRLISNDSIVTKAWFNLSSATNIEIVQAYLRFSLRLIGCEKFFIGEYGIIPASLIFGSIVFVITNLLTDFTTVTLPNPMDLVNLVSNGLLFLNEIVGLEPSLYNSLSESRCTRLELIQTVAIDVLTQSAPALRTLLTLSSIDVDMLLVQTNVSSLMLSIEGTEQRMSKIVLMSLTIIKILFTKHSEEKPGVIFEILNSASNDLDRGPITRSKKNHTVTYAHHYVLSLLELLGYPFGAKITRMALVVLRMIVIHTNVSIIACLGEKSSNIRDLLLTFIGSCDQDQVIRGLVFDFVSECVMGARHGILQLIFRNEDNDNEDRKMIGYQSCLDILKGFQLEDSVSLILLVSVSKFLLALWINDCQSNLIPHKNVELWQALLAPLKISIDKILPYDPVSLELFDYIGNVYGLFAMEIYSSSTTAIDQTVVSSLNTILDQELFVRFFDVFENSILDSDMLNEKLYLDKVVTATTWWKTLIYTLLSLEPNRGISWLSVTQESSLLTKILNAVMNLTTKNWIDESQIVPDLIDNLVSCVINIVHKRAKLFSTGQSNDIIKQIICLLSYMTSAPSFRTHRCHADLMVSCSSILLEQSVDHEILQQMSSLTTQFIIMLTMRLSMNAIDSKTLVHALTTYMACNKNINGSQLWVTDVVNSGTLVNCLSFLYDKVKCGDLSLLTQTILTFLIRVSNNRLGSNRIMQSSLISVIEIDLNNVSNEQDLIAYLTFMIQLILSVMEQSGHAANTMAFRFVSAHWERLEHLIKDACHRMAGPMSATVEQYDTTSKMLIVAASLFDMLWHLLPVRGVWPLYWSPSMINGLMDLVVSSVNALIAVLNEPSLVFVAESAHILRGGSSRLTRHVSFTANSPRKKCSGAVFDDSRLTNVANVPLQLSSTRLEDNIYRLINSSLMFYARATYLTSEDDVYAGWKYSGTLLLCDFGDRRLEGGHSSLSFGYLFSLLNSTQHLLRENLAPLVIGLDKVGLDRDLVRQIHELSLAIVVSHAICHLSKFDQSQKSQKNNFILNMKSELNCYLDGLSKSRRRSTLSSNSPISYGPKVTSTPYVAAKSPSLGESLDGFYVALDSFKRSLDFF